VLRDHVLHAGIRGLFPRVQQFHPGRSVDDPAAYRAGVVLHALLFDSAGRAAREHLMAIFLALAVPRGPCDGAGGDHLVLPALAGPEPGEIDPLQGRAVQVVARGIHRSFLRSRLSRDGAHQRLGPVRVARQRGARDGRRPHPHGDLFPVLPADALVFQARQVQAGAGPGDVGGALMLGRKKLLIALLTLPALASFSSRASESVKLDRLPIEANASDHLVSLQRRAHDSVNYCLRGNDAADRQYNRWRDLALAEEQIKRNVIFRDVKVGDLMTNALDRRSAKEGFGTAPPDLTVIARARSSGAGSGGD